MCRAFLLGTSEGASAKNADLCAQDGGARTRKQWRCEEKRKEGGDAPSVAEQQKLDENGCVRKQSPPRRLLIHDATTVTAAAAAPSGLAAPDPNGRHEQPASVGASALEALLFDVVLRNSPCPDVHIQDASSCEILHAVVRQG